MHRALSIFDVMAGNRRLGFVQEREGGGWRAFRDNGRAIGNYARPTDAREAVVAVVLGTDKARRDA